MYLMVYSATVRTLALAAALAAAVVICGAVPSAAAPSPVVPTYVMPIASSGGQPCTMPDIDAVKRVIQAKLTEKVSAPSTIDHRQTL